MHHGLADCISFCDDTAFLERRRQKLGRSQLPTTEAVCGFQREEIISLCREATSDCKKLQEQIQGMKDLPGYTLGNSDFYLGMCERMLFSALIDADWRDTADFMEGVAMAAGGNSIVVTGMDESAVTSMDESALTGMDDSVATGMNKLAQGSRSGSITADCAGKDVRSFWEAGVAAIERDLAGLSVKTVLDPLRAEISAQCREAAETNKSLYRLAVPTGAGKTKSSLRFAFHHALKFGKRHIFYVAPFRSILEQNAKVIRNIFQDIPEMEQYILEHHSDVISDSQGAEDRYERLIENWDEVPVIVTTAVQFFNTLFMERRSNIRTESQTEYIKVGDMVTLNFQNGKVKEENCQVKAINKTEEETYEAIVEVAETEVSLGETGVLEVTNQTEPYSCCIPLSALYSDNQKDYILLIRETATIMGTELSVVKKEVTIQDKNESEAALEDSSLGEEDRFVVYASKAVAPGDKVRLLEEEDEQE